ncbi:MAG: hypothetical protein U1E37_06215 [Sphingomonadaceae bacterium]
MLRKALVLLAGLALAGTQAHAQSADDELDRKVAERFEQAQAKFGAVRRKARCQPAEPGEIVVCADDGGDQRVPSTAESDPNSREARRALDGNLPSAPDVSSIKCRRGADGVCRGNFGGVPPPVYYVDVSALPQAPEGSEADRIAKGEAPAP